MIDSPYQLVQISSINSMLDMFGFSLDLCVLMFVGDVAFLSTLRNSALSIDYP